MNIHPAKGYLVAKKIKNEKEVKGLYIPTEKESEIAEIVDVYNGSKFKIGDKVVFKKFSGTEIELEEKLIIFHFKDILGTVK